MVAQPYIRPHNEAVFWVPEVTYNTGVTHAGTNVLETKEDADVSWDTPEQVVQEKRLTVAADEDIRAGKQVSNFSVPTSDLRPSGTVGTASQFGPILKALCGSQVDGHASTTTVNDVSPAVGGCTVTSASNIAIGKLVYFGTLKKARFVASVSSNDITWVPDLEAAPANSEVISIGFGFPLVTDNDESGTLYREMENICVGISGCQINEVEITVGQDGTLEMSANGEGSGSFAMVGESTVGSGYTGSATSLILAAGTGNRFIYDANVPMYITVEAEGANTEEVMKLNGDHAGGDTLTVAGAQKSTGASDHAVGAIVRAWRPTRTYVGSPINGLVGDFMVGADANNLADLGVHNIVMRLANGHAMLAADFGAKVSSAFERDGIHPRVSSVEVTGKLTHTMAKLIGLARNETSQSIWLQVGDTAGKVFCFYGSASRVQVTNPSASGSPVALHTVRFDLRETSGNDEFQVGLV